MKRKYLDPLLGAALLAVVVSGFSYTWTPLSQNSRAGVISVSADGRIICTCPSTSGQLRISRDHGQTWSIATNAPPGGSISLEPVACSATGSQIVACLSTNGGNAAMLFLSSDFGTNWTKLGLPTLSGFNAYRVASSASGSNLIAAASPSPLYFSTDSGVNWSIASAPSTNWSWLASSADGRQMAAAVNGGRIYVSTNFGADWTSNNLPAQGWASVCISADGKSIGATGPNTYISRNAGNTWMINNVVGHTISCSANGMAWTIAGTQVYTSSDGGVTWATNFSNAGWDGAMSADGAEIVINQTFGSGGLTNWLGYITPSPQLNIQATNGNVGVSWLLPSTNFVLQQSSDIAAVSWTAVTNNPTLNFSNLQLQVSVPATASNAFFRLMAQ